MSSNFEFATATRIIFGAGRITEVGKLAGELGRRALLVTGRTPERARQVVPILQNAGVTALLYAVSGEPQVSTVTEGARRAHELGCDMVISLGGGSAIDAGKAIAAMLTNGGDPMEFLEVVGGGKSLTRPSAPFLAVPTTAGTGSEVTKNAVLAVPEHRVKVSLRSPFMLPRIALIDPNLIEGVPPIVAACSGLDALTQLIEPFVCSKPNPITDALCKEAIPRAARALSHLAEAGFSPADREDMCVASLFGGLALANAGLGAVHGFAAAIGGMFPAPHGCICAALLPHVMEANVAALLSRNPGSETLSRFKRVAEMLTGGVSAEAHRGVGWTASLVTRLAVPGLRAYGISPAHFDDIAEKAARANSMKSNPIVLTREELVGILQRAL